MKLNQQTAINLLVDVVKKKLRHRDYDRVTKMADKLTKLMTGEDMSSLMIRFDPREDQTLFNQRVAITQHITSTVCQNLMKPAYKIPRSNGVRRVLRYTDDNENKKLTKFNDVLSQFWGDKSMDDYLGERWIELSYSDPNSFIIYEWDDFDNKKERAKPYPFEVSAHEAIYYQYNNNILQYLIVMNEFESGAGGLLEKVQNSEEKNILKRYTIYYNGGSITMDQLPNEEADKIKPRPVEERFNIKDKYIEVNSTIYRINFYNSGLDFIPVIRVGFRHDISTRGRTCVSPLNEAVPILMKMVKANSELDLTMALHAHPLRVQYLPECDNDDCNKGRLTDGSVCESCNGTGMKRSPTSAQDSIDLKMPRDKDDMVTLENIIAYITPSVDLIRFQDEYIKSLTAQCKEATFNSEIFSRQQIAETATGKNIDLQNVYDSLYTFAKAFAWSWEYSVKTVSRIVDMNDGLVFSYIFSRDFKMKSLNDLYNDLKLVSDSKAPSFIKQGIYDDIARIIYTDDNISYDKYRTKEEFYPYTGKSTEEVVSIISVLPVTDFNRVLWESYGWIFSELERTYSSTKRDFYEISRKAQWAAIEKIVNREIEKREVEKPDFEQVKEPIEDVV